MKSKINVFFFVFFFGAFFLYSFSLQGPSDRRESNASDSGDDNLQENVAQILKKNCSVAGCHQGNYPPMNLNLGKDKFMNSLVNIPSQGVPSLKLVDTANPEKSYLLMKIKGDKSIAGKRMPIGSPQLKDGEIKIVQDWVSSLSDTQVEGENIQPPNGNSAQESEQRKFTKPAFWGTQLINLPTTHSIGKGEVLFRISHRYYPSITEGYDSFYGLDGPAVILLSLGYGLSDNFSLTLARSKLDKEVELSMKWVLIRQGKSKIPLSAALNAGGSLVTASQPDRDVFDADNMKFNIQAILSYQLSNALSFALVPAYSSNTNHWDPSPEGTFALGTGGRFMVLNDFSIIWEWNPVLSGYKANSHGWALGIEKKVGGHVFQVFLLNSAGLTSSQFLPGGDLRLQDGDFRIGFNIFRLF
jgi:hypothetical protein